ncbi:hypothetical protein LINPERHAP2_LOCUS31309, partial [Linum perenne]
RNSTVKFHLRCQTFSAARFLSSNFCRCRRTSVTEFPSMSPEFRRHIFIDITIISSPLNFHRYRQKFSDNTLNPNW